MIKSFTVLCGILLFVGTAHSLAAATRQVRVTADNVNIRPLPSLKSEVMDQASSGEILTVVTRSEDGKWFQIVPPDRISVWVYGELVREGEVAVSRLHMRAGPGINYRSVGTLDHGTKLTVRGKQADWLKIAPAVGCAVWIHEKYLEPVVVAQVNTSDVGESPKSVVPSQIDSVTPPQEKKPPPLQVEPSRAAGQPSNLPEWAGFQALPRPPDSLVANRAQGRIITYTGIVRPTGMTFWRRPSRYRLIRRDARGRAVTRCYLRADEAALEAYKGKRVEVSGAEYWVQGVRRPVMIVRKISELEPPEQ